MANFKKRRRAAVAFDPAGETRRQWGSVPLAMKLPKKFLLGLAAVFVAIQFVRPERNLAAGPGPADLLGRHPAPPAVAQLLAVACYDCHSNHTRYPWYASIQPVGWWLDSHIRDAKEAVNFSEVGAYPADEAAKKLGECADEIIDHSMPLSSYTLIHADARLTDPQRRLLSDWFNALSAQLAEPAAQKP